MKTSVEIKTSGKCCSIFTTPGNGVIVQARELTPESILEAVDKVCIQKSTQKLIKINYNEQNSFSPQQ